MPTTSTATRSETIDAIYYDDQTDRPEWMAIRTGFFGLNTSFVPIAGGTVRDGKLHLPYTKDQVKDAPNIAPKGDLTAPRSANCSTTTASRGTPALRRR